MNRLRFLESQSNVKNDSWKRDGKFLKFYSRSKEQLENLLRIERLHVYSVYFVHLEN